MNKFSSNIRREEYPLPQTAEGISSLVNTILQGGSVNKIVIELSRPVLVYRMLSEEDISERDMDIDAVLRNVSMLELQGPLGPRGSFRTLFEMLHIIICERLAPFCWATGYGHTGLLFSWLGEEKFVRVGHKEESLLGTRVLRLKSLPEETLVLCGTPCSDADLKDVNFAIKTTMELERRDDERQCQQCTAGNRDARESGSCPQKCGSADGRLEDAAGGAGGGTWVPEGANR